MSGEEKGDRAEKGEKGDLGLEVDFLNWVEGKAEEAFGLNLGLMSLGEGTWFVGLKSSVSFLKSNCWVGLWILTFSFTAAGS